MFPVYSCDWCYQDCPYCRVIDNKEDIEKVISDFREQVVKIVIPKNRPLPSGMKHYKNLPTALIPLDSKKTKKRK